MSDQSWPMLAGAALVVLTFASFLIYILVIGSRKERREQEAIALRKRLDTQQMVRKMHERHLGSSLEGMYPDSPLAVATEETPVGVDGSSVTKILNVGTTTGVHHEHEGVPSGFAPGLLYLTEKLKRQIRESPTLSEAIHLRMDGASHDQLMETLQQNKPVPPGLRSDRDAQLSKKSRPGLKKERLPYEEYSELELSRQVLGSSILQPSDAYIFNSMTNKPYEINGEPILYDKVRRTLYCGNRMMLVDERSNNDVLQAVAKFMDTADNPHRAQKSDVWALGSVMTPSEESRRALGILNEVRAARGLRPIPPPCRGEDDRWFPIENLYYDKDARRLVYAGTPAIIDGWSAEEIQYCVDTLVNRVRDVMRHPPRGQLLNQHCENFQLHSVYTDGHGGTYTQLAERFSKQCGYTTY